MPGLYYPFIIFLGVGIGISLYLIARLWVIRERVGANFLIWAVTCVTVWSIGYILEIAGADFGTKVFWSGVEYLGIPFLPLAIFCFTLMYSGRRKWLTRNRFILLTIIPTLTFLFAVTNELHHLQWSSLKMPELVLGPLGVSRGPWYIVNIIFSYSLILLSTFFLAQMAALKTNLYRSQALLMFIGILLPWIGNMGYLLHPGLDLTPLACIVTVLAFEIGYVRLGLMDLLPSDQGQILSILQHGILMTNSRGRILEINPTAQRIFQQSYKYLVGKDVQQLFPSWSEWNAQTGTAFEIGHETTLGEGPARRAYTIKIAPILGHRGEVTGQIVTLFDITDEKQAQGQMRLQSTALEAAENGIVITDSQGRVEWANPAFTRLTGYEIYEVEGKTLGLLKSGRQEPVFYKTMWETILAGKVWQGELVNRRKDGSFYHEEMTITSLMEDGHPSHFIAIKQDVSTRKQAEEQLLQAHEQALEANRMKTQLLASVSHDLRSPLGTIMGYAEILQTGMLGKVNDEQKNAAAEILDSANRLLGFVNNLIGQAQLETGRIVIRPRLFKPAELAEGIRSLVALAAKKKGIGFETIIDKSLPEEICADSYWLKQILYNLVNNAVKFTAQGNVTVRLYPVDETHWAMQVADSGIGISEQTRQVIYEPFRQGERTDIVDGSGLGLSIVNQLTSLMKGRIELDTEVGRGTTFTVILPFSE